MRPRVAILIGLLAAAVGAAAADTAPLAVEATIPLGSVHGRLDHLAIDLRRQRLYVAELGNNSVGVVDLKRRRVLRTLTGLAQPQGIGYEPATDTLYVANAGDGSVRLYSGSDLAPLGRIELGTDADNVRVDTTFHRVWVGYGTGALAAIDPVSRTVTARIPLPAHPESFRLDLGGSRIFVNVPDAGVIVVLDPRSARQTATWRTGRLRGNFPMTLDAARHVLVVYRSPAVMAVYRSDGRLLQSLAACPDADDIFFDPPHRQVYISCGRGYVDVFRSLGNAYRLVGHLPTVAGARTSLFVPQLDALFLAVRATSSSPAALWLIRPAPASAGRP